MGGRRYTQNCALPQKRRRGDNTRGGERKRRPSKEEGERTLKGKVKKRKCHFLMEEEEKLDSRGGSRPSSKNLVKINKRV